MKSIEELSNNILLWIEQDQGILSFVIMLIVVLIGPTVKSSLWGNSLLNSGAKSEKESGEPGSGA